MTGRRVHNARPLYDAIIHRLVLRARRRAGPALAVLRDRPASGHHPPARLRWSLLAAIALLPARPGAIPLGTYTSAIAPYTIAYPLAWRHTVLRMGHLPVDVFLRPMPTSGFPDNVTVYRARVPASITDDAQLLAAGKRQIEAALHQRVRVVGVVAVGRRRQVLLGWTQLARPGPLVYATQAMFYRQGWGWYVTLTTRRGDATDLRPVLVAMLRRFRAR